MDLQPALRLTAEEYLEWEESNFEKHEYIDGEVRCMTGATGTHNRIMSNTNTAVGRQLDDSDCYLLSSEMKVKSGELRYLYPDLCAVCGEAVYEHENEMALLNPALVIEVTSPSSYEYDLGQKRSFYFDILSIQEYLVIDQQRIFVQHNTRMESRWHIQEFSELQAVIPLAVLNCALPLDQVYRGIRLVSATD